MKKQILDTFANKLANLRRDHGLTQAQAAEKVGVQVNSWQRWENAKFLPKEKFFNKIKDFFKVDDDYFFGIPLLDKPPFGTNTSEKKTYSFYESETGSSSVDENLDKNDIKSKLIATERVLSILRSENKDLKGEIDLLKNKLIELQSQLLKKQA